MEKENLFSIGKIDVAGKLRTGPNAAGFNAAMSFRYINVLRGGEPRARGLGCPVGEWVGFL